MACAGTALAGADELRDGLRTTEAWGTCRTSPVEWLLLELVSPSTAIN